jgi:putative PIN family toxin of toxin-antitoxin system
MRLVFDTNVLISATLMPKSLPAQILNWVENQQFAILYSQETIAELVSVLQRPKFRPYIATEQLEGIIQRNLSSLA